MTPLWQLSAVEQAAGVKNRTFTATELVHSALGRIEQKNAQLNAIVDLLDESALTAAQAADAAVAGGKALGPLHGVPVTVKVNVDTKGRATTNGMEIFKETIAPDHSPVVSNLLKAGAILIGRTNTPEMSMRLTTDNPLHGLTRNPGIRRRLPVALPVVQRLPALQVLPPSTTAMILPAPYAIPPLPAA